MFWSYNLQLWKQGHTTYIFATIWWQPDTVNIRCAPQRLQRWSRRQLHDNRTVYRPTPWNSRAAFIPYSKRSRSTVRDVKSPFWSEITRRCHLFHRLNPALQRSFMCEWLTGDGADYFQPTNSHLTTALNSRRRGRRTDCPATCLQACCTSTQAGVLSTERTASLGLFRETFL